MDHTTKKRNLESAILFMQQEHANTLKGLHSEIEKLQKRCSELNFKLAMNNTSTSQEEFYREQSEKGSAQLQLERSKVEKLEQQVDQRDRRLALLEQQVRAQQQRHDVELKAERQRATVIHREIDAKSNMVAHLTTQLLALKQCIKRADGHLPQSARSASSMSSEEDGVLHGRFCEPAPPKVAPPSVRRRSAGRHGSVDLQGQGQHVQMRRKVPNEEVTSVPDHTPFLQISKLRATGGGSALRKSERAVLPPITKPTPQRTNSDQFVRTLLQRAEGVSPTSEVEVESLAVDQVRGKEHSLRRAQEYNNSDS